MSLRLIELRSLVVPVSQFAAWPIFFLLTFAISQQPAYFLALLLVLAADVFDTSKRNKALVRDLMVGAATAFLAILLNDHDGLIFGEIVVVVAASRLIQKIF
jgi:hypothetical protein